ncbi:carboxy-terminal kinesin 2-like [Calonectris borealis]|uniref:carboxy-terminal kinesin 2-like n=1 Tax=Calonectris borealis TaxID=1323832 RepID=UPI003F4C41C6
MAEGWQDCPVLGLGWKWQKVYAFTASFLEIYNKFLWDLLAGRLKRRAKLEIRQADEEVHVPNLCCIPVASEEWAVLSLVDLAGSEQLDELLLGGEQPHQSQAINASFSTLGQVIVALAKKIGVSESRSPGGEVHRVLHLPALCKQGMTSTVSSPNRRK